MSDESVPPSVSPAVAPPPAEPPPRARRVDPWLIVALLALALSGWQWFETRTKLAATQEELARRLAESDGVAKEGRTLAKSAQDQLAAVQRQVGEIDGRIAEMADQHAALERLTREIARHRDEWSLAEIEQSVTLAAQQLQLAGNVQGAILALQAADARLAGGDRPQFIGLRKALARDLDRLRALPQVDLPGLNLRLESVIGALDTLPTRIDVRPRRATVGDDGATEATAGSPATAAAGLSEKPASPASLAYWQRLGRDFWRDLQGLVRIQRMDREDAPLLAPGQSFFLRENLKLRLLNARLALLARDQWTFRNELKQAESWLDRYFDPRDAALANVMGTLRQLASTEISIELPTLNDSLSAIKTLRVGKERK